VTTIVQAGPLGAAPERLLAAVAARGHALVPRPEALPAGDEPVTLVIADGPMVLGLLGTVRALGARPFRVLVLSRLGAHPDARADTLRRLWRLEEHVRGGGAPTLTLRTAPLVGPETPLWRKLRSRPPLPAGGRKLVNPVAETDVVETIARALDGRAPWGDWYEVAGSETFSLAELRDLARAPAAGGPASGSGGTGGAWEPSLEEIAELRLAESEPWASTFGIRPTPIAAWAGQAVA
jgi:uncharacterized protein YbjT (DUF2867 family)